MGRVDNIGGIWGLRCLERVFEREYRLKEVQSQKNHVGTKRLVLIALKIPLI